MEKVTSKKHYKIFSVYLFTLLLLFVGSYFPDKRVWGINSWAFVPDPLMYVILIIASVFVFLSFWLYDRLEYFQSTRNNKHQDKVFYSITTLIISVVGSLFWIFRARTHFLGDGYTLISSLESAIPLLKNRNFGEALAHLSLYRLLPETVVDRGLVSYQIISIVAGLLFMLSIVIASRWLYDRMTDRLLFLVGMSSGGYMLLFFGYVENYSLFVLSVTAYSLIGLLVAYGKLNRWLILIPFVATIFFHVLGVTLIPSLIYLLFHGTKTGSLIARQNSVLQYLFAIGAIIVAALIFRYYYTNYYFFRFAFVPIISDSFTIENYTMFSWMHLIDYLNLVILLLPGLPIFLVVLMKVRWKKIIKQPQYRYLLTLVFPTMGAAFMFDPKLGMPRDWDLFSFFGIPIGLFCYHLFLTSSVKFKQYRSTLITGIVFSSLVLISRVAVLSGDSSSVDQAIAYFSLDKSKNRNGRTVLAEFYEMSGDHQKASSEMQKWHRDFPEYGWVVRAKTLIDQNKVRGAVRLLREAVAKNPVSADTWGHLASCFLLTKQYDSALFYGKVAHGLNPHNTVILNTIGMASYYVGDFDGAEQSYMLALEVDDDIYQAHYNLAQLYKMQSDMSGYARELTRAASSKSAPSHILREAGDLDLYRNRYRQAAIWYMQALNQDSDTSYIRLLINKYPQLKQYIKLSDLN